MKAIQRLHWATGHVIWLSFWLVFSGTESKDSINCSVPNGSGEARILSNRMPPSLSLKSVPSGNLLLGKSGKIQTEMKTFLLECEAAYPAEIVYDAQEENNMAVAKRDFGYNNLLYTDFLNQSTYQFRQTEQITFQSDAKSQTFVCVSNEFPCLQHGLRASHENSSTKIEFQLDESTSIGSSLLDLSSVAIQSTDKCDALFYYEETVSSAGSAYSFRCKFADGASGEIRQFSCGNSAGCWHILRKHQLQTGCWNRTTARNQCNGCKPMPGLNNFVSSVTICTAGTRHSKIGTLVFYGLSTVDTPRPKIFFSTDALQKGEVETAPLIQIVEFAQVQELNSPLELECRVSGFASAATIQFALEYEGEEQLHYPDLVNVLWSDPGSFRYVKQPLRLNDTKLKKVHCYVPIENTYKWLHTFRPIVVQDSEMIRNLTEEEIRDFKYGNTKLDPNDAHAPINSRPFNTELEISRDCLELDEDKVLGSGQFGIVMKGFIKSKEGGKGKELVAVKTVKSNVDVETFKALLSEIKIMGYLGKHENIVSLLGACTSNIKEREVYAAIEFCENGDLLGYVKKSRTAFKDLFRPQPDSNKDSSSNTQSTYENVINLEYSNTIFTTLDLLKFAEGIANGMHYLTIKNVIHGDLAARNILVTETMGVKISDFGLSRQLLEYSNYVKKQQVPLPWKWMALESLKEMEFSIRSDVWSFGVVLWELFSLGEIPYPGCIWTHEFLDQLSSGYRMKKPEWSNDSIYNIMLDCWQSNPENRPSFDAIHSRILEITADLASKTITPC